MGISKVKFVSVFKIGRNFLEAVSQLSFSADDEDFFQFIFCFSQILQMTQISKKYLIFYEIYFCSYFAVLLCFLKVATLL